MAAPRSELPRRVRGAAVSGHHGIVCEDGALQVSAIHHLVESSRSRQFLTSLLLDNGHTVVERARLDQVFHEQRIRLLHSPDADVLRVGQLVGATRVLFVDAHVSGQVSSVNISRLVRVAVRSVNVETGEVRWSGTARYAEGVLDTEHAVQALTYWAVSRATCPGTWQEPATAESGGCQTATPPLRKD